MGCFKLFSDSCMPDYQKLKAEDTSPNPNKYNFSVKESKLYFAANPFRMYTLALINYPDCIIKMRMKICHIIRS